MSRPARGHGLVALLDATASLIADRGVGGLRIRDVAARAGLSVGSATYHFETREDLVYAALLRHTTRVEHLVAEHGQDAIAAVYGDRDLALLTVELHLHAARTGGDALDLSRRFRDAFTEYIDPSSLAVLDGAAIDCAGRHRGAPDRYRTAMGPIIDAAVTPSLP
ncbi:TetR/AcrR family transcriptional regulator [Williamsia sp. CHRR-6]|uniref:TetR/AcrR family transcriptional regulator n=1 Tax=Williamsia sp. CHRR-6 TaxID=2835871 RepID=UPI001BDAABFF|nr:helix-turn-helix domain-containing protein [Williamsia sp. CHRR-6]MBT0568640.1 helix-turn-helix transcriptional regulator [Williamsia sp. CHRR-6]